MIIRAFRKLAQKLSFYRRKSFIQKQGLSFLSPNYLFFEAFEESSVVIDVGCGTDAELAIYMVNKHNLQAFGVDPTRKHVGALTKLEQLTQGKFKHINKAVAQQKGHLVFHQSLENESGSLLKDHNNVLKDNIESYEVETLTLNDLKDLTASGQIDFLKLDLEGAEYDLLEHVTVTDLTGIKQLFVEFHHHCIEKYSQTHTRSIVDKITSSGMKHLTIDDHNYLFYHPEDFRLSTDS